MMNLSFTSVAGNKGQRAAEWMMEKPNLRTRSVLSKKMLQLFTFLSSALISSHACVCHQPNVTAANAAELA